MILCPRAGEGGARREAPVCGVVPITGDGHALYLWVLRVRGSQWETET